LTFLNLDDWQAVKEIIILFEILLATGVFLLNDGRYRPLALVNLIGSLILLPGSLVYGEFYPSSSVGENLGHFVMLFSFLISVWIIATGDINKIFRNIIAIEAPINNNYLYIWRTLLLFIFLSGIAVIVERGGIQETGLWGMLFDSERYDLLRALSHKTIGNVLVKRLYSYSLLLIPFVSVCAFVLLKYKKYRKEAFLGLLIVIFVALLSGTRGHVINILFTYLLFIIITNNKFPMKKAITLIGLSFMLLLTLSISRSSDEVDYETLSNKVHEVVRRIVASPFYTGVVHMEYVNQTGLWDYSSITPFPGKNHLGFDHINSFRVVGEWYSGSEEENMNTSEIFLQMSIFGVGVGGAVAIIMFIVTDFVVLFVSFLERAFRLPVFITLLGYFKNSISTGLTEIIYMCLILILIIFVLLAARYFLLRTVRVCKS